MMCPPYTATGARSRCGHGRGLRTKRPSPRGRRRRRPSRAGRREVFWRARIRPISRATVPVTDAERPWPNRIPPRLGWARLPRPTPRSTKQSSPPRGPSRPPPGSSLTAKRSRRRCCHIRPSLLRMGLQRPVGTIRLAATPPLGGGAPGDRPGPPLSLRQRPQGPGTGGHRPAAPGIKKVEGRIHRPRQRRATRSANLRDQGV